MAYKDKSTSSDRKLMATFESYCESKKDAFYFVQIGANDGITCDPIRQRIQKYRWSGLMVEPVEHLYRRLVALYANDPKLRFENAAIGISDGTMPFHFFPDALDKHPDFPWWGKGMGSLLGAFDSPAHRLLAKGGFRMHETQVPCLTFGSLMIRHEVQSIDLLQIDAEGFDGEILLSIDFTRWQPRFIRYEDRHIQRVYEQGLTKYNAIDVTRHLSAAGYYIGSSSNGFDRFCMRINDLPDKEAELKRC